VSPLTGRIRWIAGGAGLIVAISLGVFVIRGGQRTADPKVSRAVPGFGEVAFKVTGPTVSAAMATKSQCALLATTPAQQQTGLMNRHDLAGYDGMIFQFKRPTTVAFYMKDTLIPLSIAWFDGTGKFLNSSAMLPCPKTWPTCPTFSAISPYSVAIEVRTGVLSQLGIGPGARIRVGGPC
jgi:uncharacterized membrane protein (UPF0127 family)